MLSALLMLWLYDALPIRPGDWVREAPLALSSMVDETLRDPGPLVDSARTMRDTLRMQASTMNPDALDDALQAVRCADARKIPHNNLLAVIDYSMPSSEKRLWVFDLAAHTVLFHTWVSHGIASGALMTNAFSNRFNSRATSIGVFKTIKPYYGREGLSLRLAGLDYGFNENAEGRYIVMHGGWYMDDGFIRKYGRPGRSWGCPAVPLSEVKPLINTIAENTLFVAWFPDNHWFGKSRFLHCSTPTASARHPDPLPTVAAQPVPPRDPILFADINQNGRHEENEPVLAISASDYQRIFGEPAPLGRMLRRQIQDQEYVALNQSEFARLSQGSQGTGSRGVDGLQSVVFIIPVLREIRGYYETEMHMVPLGTIRALNTEEGTQKAILNNNRTLTIRSDNSFIRWLGL